MTKSKVREAILITLLLFSMIGCDTQKDIKTPIIIRASWDGEEAIEILSTNGEERAAFKIADLKKLEMFLYDKGLDYTDEYKNYKGWRHNFKGERIKIND